MMISILPLSHTPGNIGNFFGHTRTTSSSYSAVTLCKGPSSKAEY